MQGLGIVVGLGAWCFANGAALKESFEISLYGMNQVVCAFDRACTCTSLQHKTQSVRCFFAILSPKPIEFVLRIL